MPWRFNVIRDAYRFPTPRADAWYAAAPRVRGVPQMYGPRGAPRGCDVRAPSEGNIGALEEGREISSLCGPFDSRLTSNDGLARIGDSADYRRLQNRNHRITL